MINIKAKIKKLSQTKGSTCLLKMNLKSWKHLIQATLEVKTILKMVNKIIYYFSQCKDILKGLVVLVLVITFILSYIGNKTRVEFKGGCLKQDKVIYDHGKVVNVYTVYNLNYLFGAVSLTKNADNDKYFGYVFDLIDTDFFFFLKHPSGGTGRNVIIFGADMRSQRLIIGKKIF